MIHIHTVIHGTESERQPTAGAQESLCDFTFEETGDNAFCTCEFTSHPN